MALDTVQNYVDDARVLLQDQRAPYRYPDADLVLALNMSLLEAKKLRPDLYINRTIPAYSIASPSTSVVIDDVYRVAHLYYVVGQAQLRDDEEVQDQRAAAFLNMFTQKLLSLAG